MTTSNRGLLREGAWCAVLVGANALMLAGGMAFLGLPTTLVLGVLGAWFGATVPESRGHRWLGALAGSAGGVFLGCGFWMTALPRIAIYLWEALRGPAPAGP